MIDLRKNPSRANLPVGPEVIIDYTPSSGSEPAFEYVQATPAATWSITHNLGRRPYVDVYIDDELVETDVDSTSTTTTITFPTPYAGVAVLF